MTPTIVLKDGKPFMITGSPGGSRIITTVLQIVSNVIDRGMPLADSVAAPRLHHQWLPDEVVAEPGIPADLIAALQARGHRVVVGRNATSANSIGITTDGFAGVADMRTRGALAAGY
jgi:gamma-glutamyltranspeptidase/glutathione hydrolase